MLRQFAARTLHVSARTRASGTPPVHQAAGTGAVPASTGHGSLHWQAERILSVALLPLCVAPIFTGPSKTADFLLGFIVPLHCHLGFEQIVTDYLNRRKIGAMHSVIMAGLYGATALTMYGLYKFNTTDVGITEAVRNMWRGPRKQQQEKQ